MVRDVTRIDISGPPRQYPRGLGEGVPDRHGAQQEREGAETDEGMHGRGTLHSCFPSMEKDAEKARSMMHGALYTTPQSGASPRRGWERRAGCLLAPCWALSYPPRVDYPSVTLTPESAKDSDDTGADMT